MSRARGGPRRLRGRLASLALAAASLLLAVGLAEGVLRVLDRPHAWAPKRASRQFQFLDAHAHPDIGYLNRASSEIWFEYDGDPRGALGPGGRVVHRTNRLGFRGGEFPPPAPGSFRIAFLGDSFTFGEGVEDDETYPERTRRALSERRPRVDVVALNLGVGGHDTGQSLALLDVFGLPLRPDALVLGYAMNDVKPPLFEVDPATGRYRRRAPDGPAPPGRRPPDYPLLRLRLVRLAWDAWVDARRSRFYLDEYRALYAEDSPRWRETRAALRALGERCVPGERPCFAVLFPLLASLSDYPLEAEHARVRAALEEAGFSVVDALTLLRGRDERGLWVHPSDHHPNEVVHALVGEALASALDREAAPLLARAVREGRAQSASGSR